MATSPNPAPLATPKTSGLPSCNASSTVRLERALEGRLGDVLRLAAVRLQHVHPGPPEVVVGVDHVRVDAGREASARQRGHEALPREASARGGELLGQQLLRAPQGEADVVGVGARAVLALVLTRV